MTSKLACIGLTSLLVAACGGASSNVTGGGDGGSTTDGGGRADSGSASDSGGTDSGFVADAGGADTGGGATDAPPDAILPACNAPSIDLTFAGCPATPTCGGAIADGTYWYTAGCIPDPWAKAKQACPSLQVTAQQGTVQGCVWFAGNQVARNVTSHYSATVNVPSSCLVGGTTCSQLQTGLQNYFQTVSCTQSNGGCTCMASDSVMSTAGGTYTTANGVMTTSSNNKYDYCVSGADLGIGWVSGPNPEPGVYSLAKQ